MSERVSGAQSVYRILSLQGPHPVRGRTAQLRAEALLARGDTAGAVTSLTQASTHYAGLPRNHPRVRQVETTLATLR